VVRQIAEQNQIGFTLNSGTAQATIPPHGKMWITMVDKNVRGVVAIITF